MADGVIAQARAWLEVDWDPDTRSELEALLRDAESDSPTTGASLAALESAFAGVLEFGTAGLRGPIGAGPARMNQMVVARAAAGVGAWLTDEGLGGGRILVGYDARHKSDDFARISAEVLAGAGFDVLVTDGPTPTPVVAFGTRHLDCVAGIVVTASHNPPADNGYKIYLGDGSQIIPPVDGEIHARIMDVAIAELGDLPRGTAIHSAGPGLVQAYVARAASLVPADAPRELTWVYSAMHGVGAETVHAVASAAGFPAPLDVAEQLHPDPEFPTVAFPNPEEDGAIDLAVALASEHDADLVIANDPDADRCAVAAKVDGGWRMLTGDELGGLLGDDAIRREVPGVFANSVVSSTLLRTMATSAGREHRQTLTGFKWIGRVPDLAFGYEEAIGYCCDPAAVPDKDGITAALTVLRLAAELKAAGHSIADRLDEIAAAHGLHATSQLSVRVADLSLIAEAMSRLRARPPERLLGREVEYRDLRFGTDDLPPTDAVELWGDGVHVVARPSGTEPKLKCYLEVVLPPDQSDDGGAARGRAAELLDRLRAEMADALGVSTP